MTVTLFLASAGDEIRGVVKEISGTLLVDEEILGPNGSTLCSPATSGDRDCIANTSGSHTLLIKDNAYTNTGGYLVKTLILNNPQGCTQLWYIVSLNGAIDTALEHDCYTFVASDGSAGRFVVNEISGTLPASQELLGPNGNTICSSTTANQRDCLTSTSGVHTSS